VKASSRRIMKLDYKSDCGASFQCFFMHDFWPVGNNQKTLALGYFREENFNFFCGQNSQMTAAFED